MAKKIISDLCVVISKKVSGDKKFPDHRITLTGYTRVYLRYLILRDITGSPSVLPTPTSCKKLVDGIGRNHSI